MFTMTERFAPGSFLDVLLTWIQLLANLDQWARDSNAQQPEFNDKIAFQHGIKVSI